MSYFIKLIIKFITDRLFILSLIIILMFYIIFNRLFTLQIIEGEKYNNAFNTTIPKKIIFSGTRGNIFDRFGRSLTQNNYAFSVFLDLTNEILDKNKFLHDLITIIEENDDKILYDFPIHYSNEKDFYFNVSKKNTKPNVISPRTKAS